MSTALSATPAGRLHVSERVEERLRKGELTRRQIDEFRSFLDQVEREFMRHRVVTDNKYTRWFAKGEATDEELKHFIRQFSVFSNRFLVSALLRVIHAPNQEQMRAAKEILMNELGVIYHKPGAAGNGAARADSDKDREGGPELVNIEGTVD